jgi:large subunit ribosomal protein L31
MKPAIHPEWFPDAKVICACGHTFTVGSTAKEIHTEVCSNCHPFFTGEQRIVDTAGQVERFMRRLEAGVEQHDTERERRERKRQQDIEAKRRRRGLTPLQAQRAARAPVLIEEEGGSPTKGSSSPEPAAPPAEE